MATLTISYPASGSSSDPNYVPGDGFFAIWGVLTAGEGEDVMMAQFDIATPGINVVGECAIDEACCPAATAEKKYWGFVISRAPTNTTNPAFTLNISASGEGFAADPVDCNNLKFGAAYGKPGPANP